MLPQSISRLLTKGKQGNRFLSGFWISILFFIGIVAIRFMSDAWLLASVRFEKEFIFSW